MIGMSDAPEAGTVAPFRLTASVAQSRIRQIASVTQNVIWGAHARARMAERDLLDIDILRVLRGGYVEEAPEKTPSGEWKCKVTLKIRGGRTAGVVVILLRNDRLFLKTVEWEDL